jgi:hypothetical protein
MDRASLGYGIKARPRNAHEEPESGPLCKLGSLNLLMADLRKRGVVTKLRTLKGGRTNGGIPFTRGPLAHLLRNRFYIGEVAFKGEILRGEQPPIIGRDLFDAVQAKLTEQATNREAKRISSEALLTGLIYDDRGNRMSPTHARKGGIKYRYYISGVLLQGVAESAGSCAECRQLKSNSLWLIRCGNTLTSAARSTIGQSSRITSVALRSNQID